MVALATLLAETDDEPEFVVEITGRNVVTDVVTTFYYSLLGSVPDTGGGDTPPNTSFPARLLDPGTIDVSLSEDLLFSGTSATSVEGIRIRNDISDPGGAGDCDTWPALYTFGGRDLVIKAGEAGAAYSTFEVVYKGKIRGEPQVTTEDATFSLQSPMERLDVPLRVNRYVGIPTGISFLTASGSASAPTNAAYALPSFSVVGRFKTTGVASGSGSGSLIDRQFSPTNRHFRVGIYWAGDAKAGKLVAGATSGGTALFTDIETAASYADGLWHVYVLAILDKSSAYFMVDGVIIGERTFTAAVDTPAEPVRWRSINGAKICDSRIYSSYLTPDEARIVTAARIEGDETGVVALWQCDDNTGSTISDYSTNNNDATAAGVLNTDWEWAPTDLGMPEFAGRPMPIVHGAAYNCPLHYHDTIRERLRGHDGTSDAGFAFAAVRSRGEVLTEPADYTDDAAAGIVAAVGELDEPTTFDAASGPNEDLPSEVLESLVGRASGMAVSDVDVDWSSSFSFLIPSPSGIFSDDDRSLSELLAGFLSGLGTHARQNGLTGKLIFHHLLPPVGPGPYGTEAVLEFVGQGTAAVDFGNIANPTGSMSLACWFKNARGLRVPGSNFSRGPLISKDSGSGGYYFELSSLGGLEGFVRNLGSLGTDPLIAKADKWYFSMTTFDDAADTLKIFLGESGNALREVSSRTLVGAPTTSTATLKVGGNGSFPMMGSVCYVQVWSKAHSLAQAQALMDAPPVGNEANLLMYSPMTDGSGTTVRELVAGGTGTITGLVRWAPKLNLDLSLRPGAALQMRTLIPSAKLTRVYRRNHLPLAVADVAAAVSEANSADLRRPFSESIVPFPDVEADYLDARPPVRIVAPLQDAAAVSYVADLVNGRFSPGRGYGDLTGVDRDALLLDLTDEVKITSTRHDLPSGRHFRVVGKAARLANLQTDLKIWG